MSDSGLTKTAWPCDQALGCGVSPASVGRGAWRQSPGGGGGVLRGGWRPAGWDQAQSADVSSVQLTDTDQVPVLNMALFAIVCCEVTYLSI